VLYPPIEINDFSYEESGDFYLSTGRLETVKNIKFILEAFKIMQNKKLVISSGGSLYKKYKYKYKDYKNIIFTGWLTKDQQKDYISKCIATIYVPFHEDFGMSSVESLAAGKPVLGINEGGQKEILSHKKNSFLCNSSMLVKDIIKGVEFLNKEKSKEMKMECIKTSKKFSSKKFNESFLNIIK
jgi:glycosyltransferase involved in cell wall biosynthesis